MKRKNQQTNSKTNIGPTGNDHSGSMANLTLAIPSYTSVVPNILVSDIGDTQFCSIVKDAGGGRRLHRILIFVPQYFRRRGTLSLAV
jgi:hypothetical protein